MRYDRRISYSKIFGKRYEKRNIGRNKKVRDKNKLTRKTNAIMGYYQKLKLGGYYDSRAYYWNNLCYID